MSKAEGQRIHAKRRALERYGVEFNREDLDRIIQQIRSKTRSISYFRITNRLSLHKVFYENIDVPLFVVYDKSRGTIATFLTQAMALDKVYDE